MKKNMKACSVDIAIDRSSLDPTVSLLVPVYNEEESVNCFVERVNDVLNSHGIKFNILFVDDGSDDLTLNNLIKLSSIYDFISVISLSRNFGKEAALSAAIDNSDGDVMVPIDVDLQDPPELIVEFLRKWKEGYDVVYGLRSCRKSDAFTKRLTSGWFYKLFNKISKVKLPADAGDFRLIDRRVAESVRGLNEKNRFMKGLFAWVGFKSIGVPYERPSRFVGVSKWSYWKLWNFAIDGIVSFSTVPIRIWTYIGALVSVISFMYASFIILKVMIYGIDVPGYASLLIAVLFFGGTQLLSIGIIGEYIGRLFVEVKDRPVYIVDKRYSSGKQC